MRSAFKNMQGGMAIMEALIALGVLGVGVAALLYLQGNLMSGNSLSKARAEAMKIAEYSISEVRNYVEVQQYNDAVEKIIDDQSNGIYKEVTPDNNDKVNVAKYTVTYTFSQEDDSDPDNPVLRVIDDIFLINLSKTQQIEVQVEWEGSELDGGNTKKESVTLASNYYFLKPAIAATIAEQNDGEIDPSDFELPSPWLTGVEGPHKSTDKFKDNTDGNEPVDSAHDILSVLKLDDSGEVFVGSADIEIKTYHNSITGLSNVEIVDGTNADGTPKVVLTSFGGIVHRLKGEIILHQDADTVLTTIIENFKLLASPPSYCVAPICADGDCKILSCDDVVDNVLCNSGISTGEYVQYVSYVCYVPGDCTHGDVDGDEAKGCPDPFSPPPDKDLNGGWYGRIGNFNLFLDREKDMVCTADTLIGGANPNMTPSREYATHRWELIDSPYDVPDQGTIQMITGNEGINRPFDCNPDPEAPTGKAFAQTFIIAGIVNNDATACLDIAAQYTILTPPLTLKLPPENVIRIIGERTSIPPTLTLGHADYPAPYPPLTDLIVPFTPTNVVLPTFDDYCIQAPVAPVAP